MSAVILQIPDDLELALNVPPDALAPAVLAELAGIPKPLFLVKLPKWSMAASTLSAEDITQDIANV